MYGDIIPLLGEKSRAWLSSVQHLSPQEVQQHAVLAAQTGLMPFADALAIKQAADRVSQSSNTQAPPPGNVMNELQSKIRAAITGQPVAPQMSPQIPVAPQQGQMDPRMMAGLGTLPASNVGTQNMAGGGIVAFADGGGVGDILSYFNLLPEQQAEITRLQKEQAPVEQDEKQKALDEYMANDRGKALRTREEKLTAREAQNKERFGKEGRWARAAGFFQAAAEAAKPGSTFLGSVSGGLGNMARVNAAMSDKIEEAQSKLEDQQFAVQQAREDLQAKGTDYAQAQYEKALARYDADHARLLTLLGQQQNMRGKLGAALISASAKGGNDTLGKIIGPRIAAARAALDNATASGDGAAIDKATNNYNAVLADAGKISAQWQALEPKQRQKIDEIVNTNWAKAVSTPGTPAYTLTAQISHLQAKQRSGSLTSEEATKLKTAKAALETERTQNAETTYAVFRDQGLEPQTSLPPDASVDDIANFYGGSEAD